MKIELLIPLFGDTDEQALLFSDIAGLPFIQRVVLLAEKVGVSSTLLLQPEQSHSDNKNFENHVKQAIASTSAHIMDINACSDGHVGHAVLLLAANFLPTIDFFQQLKEGAFETDTMLDSEGQTIAWLGNKPENFASLVKQADNSQALLALLVGADPAPEQVLPASSGFVLRTRADRKMAENALFSSLIKQTDGFLASHINRKISLAVTRRLIRTRITPNQMSLVSIAIGLLAALLLLIDSYTAQVLAAMLFLAHSILDGCDGELARLKFMESRFGGILDYWGDNIVHIAVFGCLGIGLTMHSNTMMPLWLGAAAVLGTLISASLVFIHTMQSKAASGPLYTSVSTTRASAMSKIADMLSRRDFIYLVLILALFGKLDWFLLLTAIGAPIYAILLVFIHLSDKKAAALH